MSAAVPCNARSATKRSWTGSTRVVLALFLASCVQVVHAGGCSVSSSGLAFGAYQTLSFAGKIASAEVASTATISIRCTGISLGGSYTLSLGPTTAGGASINPRRMANGANSGGDAMLFNAYTDAARTNVWGDGSTGSQFAGTIAVNRSSVQNFTHTAYGKILGGQTTLKAGTYSAAPTITLTYNP